MLCKSDLCAEDAIRRLDAMYVWTVTDAIRYVCYHTLQTLLCVTYCVVQLKCVWF